MLNQIRKVNNPMVASAIGGTSTLKPTIDSWKKVAAASLMLTSLVDAFSILVVYLLLNFSAEEIITIDSDISLPQATQATDIRRDVVVTIKNNKVFIKNEEVPSKKMLSTLIAIRREQSKNQKKMDKAKVKKNQKVADAEINEKSLTIQADKAVKYKMLNNIVMASNSAGYSNINFAVLEK